MILLRTKAPLVTALWTYNLINILVIIKTVPSNSAGIELIPVTSENQVRSQVSPFRIYDRQTGFKVDFFFSLSTSVSPVNIFRPMLHTHSLITYRHYLFAAIDKPIRHCTLWNNHIPMLLYISECWTLKEYIISSIKKAETIFLEVTVRCRSTKHTRNKNMNRTKHKIRNRL